MLKKLLLLISISLVVLITGSVLAMNGDAYGTFSVSPNPVDADETITITVQGSDGYDVKALRAFYKGAWQPDYQCTGVQTSCSHVWTTTESNPGTYTYKAKIIGDSTTYSPSNIIVTVKTTAGSSSGVPIEINNPLDTESFEELIDNIINFIFMVAIVAAPAMIIIGGFFLVTAVGDPEKIDRGKRIIFWSLVGLVIIMLAKGLISALETIL
ncbi:pilin [Patescibacteria group bacterium]